jgi:phosphoglucomutase
VDPLGGAGVGYWEPINAVTVSTSPSSTRGGSDVRFMTVDHDGRIRMDCSSPYAMARLVEQKDRIASRSRTIPTPTGTASSRRRPGSSIRTTISRSRSLSADAPPGLAAAAAIGKTLVSSSHDRSRRRSLGARCAKCRSASSGSCAGLLDGSFCFGGEESAGASFLRRDGRVWTTDKDGLILGSARRRDDGAHRADPGEHYRDLPRNSARRSTPRIDTPATPEQKARSRSYRPPRSRRRSRGRADHASAHARPATTPPIGGLKVTAASGWFAARPSGTENLYKLYAESFRDERHLQAIVAEARQIVETALAAPPGAT